MLAARGATRRRTVTRRRLTHETCGNSTGGGQADCQAQPQKAHGRQSYDYKIAHMRSCPGSSGKAPRLFTLHRHLRQNRKGSGPISGLGRKEGCRAAAQRRKREHGSAPRSWGHSEKLGTHSSRRGASRAILGAGSPFSQLLPAAQRNYSAYHLYLDFGQ